jgi:hypothetical protein
LRVGPADILLSCERGHCACAAGRAGSCVGRVSAYKIERNDLLNGRHSRDVTYIRLERAKTTPHGANIFVDADNSIVFLSTTGCLKSIAPEGHTVADCVSRTGMSKFKITVARIVRGAFFSGLLTLFLKKHIMNEIRFANGARSSALGRNGSGAAGAGRTWPRLTRRRWSAGRRRTPTSLGCARRIATARGGPSQGSPGVRIATRPGASRRSISLACKGEGKGERATPGARKPKSPGGGALSSRAV